MSMISMVVGGTTESSAVFVAKVDNGPVAIAYDTDPGMGSPTTSSSVAVDAQGVARVEVSGLTADTQYYWQVVDNGVRDTGTTGRFRTHPAAAGEAASFTIAVCADAGDRPVSAGVGAVLASSRMSNHPCFDTIRAADPLMVCHLGDLHYYDLSSGNWGIVGGGSLANYRRAYDDVLLQTRQHQLYREVPWVYMWDDHDYGPNDGDGTYAEKGNAAQVYRERVPHYDLEEVSGALYHSFHVGRVLFVVSDTRYERSPNGATDDASKTMLGANQKAWLDSLLASDTSEALVWLMPTPWLGGAADSWASFTTERAELVDIITDNGWASRTVMVCGDAHVNAIASAAGNPHGGWPVAVTGAVDAIPNSGTGSQYDVSFRPGRNQWATIDVHDPGGDEVVVTVTLRRGSGVQSWVTLNTAGMVTRRRPSPSHVLAL